MLLTPRRRLAITSAAGVIALAALAFWSQVTYPVRFRTRTASDTRRLSGAEKTRTVNLQGTLMRGNGTPGRTPGRWPRFLGANFDNTSRETVPLATSWGPAGPPVLWKIRLGEGYAGPSVHDGRVYILDYDEQRKADTLRCLSLDTGAEIWSRRYAVTIKRNHGISRTVPATDGRHVVTIGPKCHVLCVDAKSGAFRWGIDLVREYGTKVPLWYTGQCPLLDNGTAVLAPGGKDLLIGVEASSGRILWKTPNPGKWQMSHASVIPMTFHGRRMYVYAALGGMAGVAADGPARGKILWSTTAWNHSVVAPSPVRVSGNRLFVTTGHGGGSMLFRIEKRGQTFSARRLATISRETFASEQQTPIYFRGFLFAVLPNDAGMARRRFVCYTPGGKVVWQSDKQIRFGLGPFLLADGKFLVVDDRGYLSMVAADTGRYRLITRARVLYGRDSWGPLALVDGRLLLRDLNEMRCLDLRARR